MFLYSTERERERERDHEARDVKYTHTHTHTHTHHEAGDVSADVEDEVDRPLDRDVAGLAAGRGVRGEVLEAVEESRVGRGTHKSQKM
jgi:hypothetical protein